jgi:hypothetical protein
LILYFYHHGLHLGHEGVEFRLGDGTFFVAHNLLGGKAQSKIPCSDTS